MDFPDLIGSRSRDNRCDSRWVRRPPGSVTSHTGGLPDGGTRKEVDPPRSWTRGWTLSGVTVRSDSDLLGCGTRSGRCGRCDGPGVLDQRGEHVPPRPPGPPQTETPKTSGLPPEDIDLLPVPPRRSVATSGVPCVPSSVSQVQCVVQTRSTTRCQDPTHPSPVSGKTRRGLSVGVGPVVGVSGSSPSCVWAGWCFEGDFGAGTFQDMGLIRVLRVLRWYFSFPG